MGGHRKPKLTKEKIAKLHSEAKTIFDYILLMLKNTVNKRILGGVLSSLDLKYWET